MLRGVLICPNNELIEELATAVPNVGDLDIVHLLTTYASPDELIRTIRAHKADLMLLCTDDFARTKASIKTIDELMPGFPIITISGRDDVQVLHKLMRLGIREHLTSPVQDSTLRKAVETARRRPTAHPLSIPRPANLYTFFPAKPGVGASTISVSTSCALANDLGVKTLLLDGDLAAGTIHFLLKLGPTASLIDALTHAEKLDEDLWFQLIGRWAKLEVLQAGELDSPCSADPGGLENVLSMARAKYEVICADLGSQFDSFTMALLRESSVIFLTTTAEVVALHLARMRMRRLTELGLADRVRLLLNRRVRGDTRDSEIEKAVGLPVSCSFSNDYGVVQNAILQASPVPNGSELKQSILSFAQSLAPGRQAKRTSRGHKFLQFFRISREQDTDTVWHG